MEPSSRDEISESALLIHVSCQICECSLAHLINILLLQPRIETAQMSESSVTGAERAHCQSCQTEEVTAVCQTGEDLDKTLENVESAVSSSQKVMAKFATSATGSVRDHYHLFLSRIGHHEMEVVHEQMMAQKERVSEIANHRQLRGVKADHKAHKTADRDHQDVNSRSDLLSSVLLLLLSRITNGVQR